MDYRSGRKAQSTDGTRSLKFVWKKISDSGWSSGKGTLERSQRRFITSSEVIPTVTAMLKFHENDAT